MLTLHELLTRLKKSLGDDTVVRGEIALCIKEILNFNIEPSEISINGHAVRIQTTATKKNEIKINEQKILVAIKQKTRLNLQAIVY